MLCHTPQWFENTADVSPRKHPQGLYRACTDAQSCFAIGFCRTKFSFLRDQGVVAVCVYPSQSARTPLAPLVSQTGVLLWIREYVSLILS